MENRDAIDGCCDGIMRQEQVGGRSGLLNCFKAVGRTKESEGKLHGWHLRYTRVGY